MTFREARLSLQLEAVERVGAPRRQPARMARAAEDAAAGAVRSAVEGSV